MASSGDLANGTGPVDDGSCCPDAAMDRSPDMRWSGTRLWESAVMLFDHDLGVIANRR